MSWREKEFSHESEAYYRSLDQAWTGRECVAEAMMGGHAENGMSVIDWFTVLHRGRKIRVDFGYDNPESVLIIIEGNHYYKVPRTDQIELISAARALVLTLFKDGDERSNGGNHSDHSDRAADSGRDLPNA